MSSPVYSPRAHWLGHVLASPQEKQISPGGLEPLHGESTVHKLFKRSNWKRSKTENILHPDSLFNTVLAEASVIMTTSSEPCSSLRLEHVFSSCCVHNECLSRQCTKVAMGRAHKAMRDVILNACVYHPRGHPSQNPKPRGPSHPAHATSPPKGGTRKRGDKEEGGGAGGTS